MLFMALGQSSQACVPFLMRKFINWIEKDRFLADYSPNEGWWVAAIIAGCLLLKTTFDRRGRYYTFFTSVSLASSLRGLAFEKITKLNPSVRPHFGVGNCVNTIINDTENLGRGVNFFAANFYLPFLDDGLHGYANL